MGKSCVAGVSALEIDYGRRATLSANGAVVRRGEYITLDGSAGEVIEGRGADGRSRDAVVLQEISLVGGCGAQIGGGGRMPTLRMTQKIARDFGAEGIGLTRTEHMFFDPQRISAVRENDHGGERGTARARRWQKYCRCSGRTSSEY